MLVIVKMEFKMMKTAKSLDTIIDFFDLNSIDSFLNFI